MADGADDRTRGQPVGRSTTESPDQGIALQGNIRQLGPYRLIRQLGQGAMGSVYLAQDTMLDREIALKVLPKAQGDNREFVARFKREATAAGKLNHVNIAGAYAVDEDHGYHYYAMEFCDGLPLNELLKKSGRLPEKQVLDLGIQMARGLQFAHEHGIIHRDIKPENAILTKDQIVKVLDMGLSKNLAMEEGFQTMGGMAMGTPHYISPEQARGESDIDGRADVYSLGATLYHLATGSTPFTGATAVVVMTKHLTDPLPDPRNINPALSDGMVHILNRAMAKSPADRYQNMASLLEDMELVLNGEEPVHAVTPSGRSNIPGRGGRLANRSGSPTDHIPAVMGGRSPQRMRRTSGPQEAVRSTGRQQPLEGRPTTGARSAIEGRSSSTAQDGKSPRSNSQMVLLGAGAGLLLLTTVALILWGRGEGNQTASNDRKQVVSAAPKPSNPQVPDLPPALPEPATPKLKPVVAPRDPAPVPPKTSPRVPEVAPPTPPPAAKDDYDPREKVALSRLNEIRAFAAQHPEDPWSCAELLKDLISGYRGMKATEEAKVFLAELTFEGEPPAAHRNWHLEWEKASGAKDERIGSMSTSLDGRLWVLMTTPPADGAPLIFQRELEVPADKPFLIVQVHGYEEGSFALQVDVDGKSLLQSSVAGKPWRTLSLDLKEWAGRKALVRIQQTSTSGTTGMGFWVAPDFAATAAPVASPLPTPVETATAQPGDCVFLSDLNPTEAKVGWGRFGRAGDLGYEGQQIRVDGAPAPKGLSTHPPSNGESRVAYTLGKRFSVFQSRVALNDSAGANGCATPVNFIVMGDGKPLWTSQPMQRPRQPQSVEVSVENVDKLELLVRCKGSFSHAHAIWLDPRLLPPKVVQPAGKDPGGKPAPVASTAVATESPLARFKGDLAKAEIKGAEVLKDQRPFRLQPLEGKAIDVGKDAKNRVLEVKNGALQIEQSIGGGKMVVPMAFTALDARTRYELTALGLPAGPEREWKLAYAGALMLQDGEREITTAEINRHLEAAAKDPAQAQWVALVREELENAAGEPAALKAWQRAEDLFERKMVKEARAAYDAFQRTFGQTPVAAEKADLLKQRYQVLDAATAPTKGLTLDLGAGVRMEFVQVPAGEFQMGFTGRKPKEWWQANEGPAHKVTISKPFYIAKYPVTVAQFARFVDATKYQTTCEKSYGKGSTLVDGKWVSRTGINWKAPGFPQTPLHPVVLVNWGDMQAFTSWVNRQVGAEVRLPTEAEWEYAARGPLNLEYPFGNTWDGTRVNHKDASLKEAMPQAEKCSGDHDGYAFTSPVGKLDNASWCGAFDMVGNVWQAVQDFRGDYPADPQVDPTGPVSGSYRMCRGGNWNQETERCRATFRAQLSTSASAADLGFRVVIAAKPE